MAKVAVEFIEQTEESFDSKSGRKTLHIAVCLDRTPEGRLINTFDYVLTPDELVKYNGKLTGKMGEVIIKKIDQNFANRLRMEGSIVSVK